MPKLLYVIAPERFRDEELLEPRHALEQHPESAQEAGAVGFGDVM